MRSIKNIACVLVLLCFSTVGIAENNQEMHGATTCISTGAGPGNHAACGSQATTCISTGAGPGNDAACGGKATTCISTGAGRENDAACGGEDGIE